MAKKNFLPQNMQSLYTLYFVKKKYQTTLPTCYVYQANCQFISIPMVNHGNYEQHHLGTWIFIYMYSVYIYKSALYFYRPHDNWNHATIYDKSLREFSECTYTLSEFRRNNTMAGQVYSLCILIHSFCLPFSLLF